MVLTRREALAALAATAASPLAPGCTPESAQRAAAEDPEAAALALLDGIAENLLRLVPESATSLGIDTGARAALRSQLADRSAQGQERISRQVREDLEHAKAIDV